jgi:bifunctional UDP-N-acetylglucosamine pyrophosphorylase/glucosamine-1-phosphate N-acetyltransferase
VAGIVEHKDASEAQRAIDEIYSGIMAVPARLLKPWLARLTNHNAQGEYYLTDIVAMAVAEGLPVVAHRIDDALQVAGVNSPCNWPSWSAPTSCARRALMEQGVRLMDPARFDLRDDARTGVRGQLRCGQDVEIDVGCIFTGAVELGEGVQVGAHCCIANARIAAGAVIHPFTHIDGEKPVPAWARVRSSARLPACAPAPCWGARCTSATSWR